eukprot:Clim_evm24s232 gene=Clim_evmTU24s232
MVREEGTAAAAAAAVDGPSLEKMHSKPNMAQLIGVLDSLGVEEQFRLWAHLGNKSTCNMLQLLPREVMYMILMHLEPRDIEELQYVSRYFLELLMETDESLMFYTRYADAYMKKPHQQTWIWQNMLGAGKPAEESVRNLQLYLSLAGNLSRCMVHPHSQKLQLSIRNNVRLPLSDVFNGTVAARLHADGPALEVQRVTPGSVRAAGMPFSLHTYWPLRIGISPRSIVTLCAGGDGYEDFIFYGTRMGHVGCFQVISNTMLPEPKLHQYQFQCLSQIWAIEHSGPLIFVEERGAHHSHLRVMYVDKGPGEEERLLCRFELDRRIEKWMVLPRRWDRTDTETGIACKYINSVVFVYKDGMGGALGQIIFQLEVKDGKITFNPVWEFSDYRVSDIDVRQGMCQYMFPLNPEGSDYCWNSMSLDLEHPQVRFGLLLQPDSEHMDAAESPSPAIHEVPQLATSLTFRCLQLNELHHMGCLNEFDVHSYPEPWALCSTPDGQFGAVLCAVRGNTDDLWLFIRNLHKANHFKVERFVNERKAVCRPMDHRKRKNREHASLSYLFTGSEVRLRFLLRELTYELCADFVPPT